MFWNLHIIQNTRWLNNDSHNNITNKEEKIFQNMSVVCVDRVSNNGLGKPHKIESIVACVVCEGA